MGKQDHDGACLHCGAAVGYSGRGRPRRYCSSACREQIYAKRRREASMKELVERDNPIVAEFLAECEV